MASEKVRELTKKLEQGIDDLFNSDRYEEYLRTMSKFHMYSMGNIMLIMLQRPDASRVAGFNTWKKVGRHVRKGEKAIQILAPCPHKLKVESDDGTESEELVIHTSFRPASVFDISQTEGAGLPEIASQLQGNVTDFDKLFDKISKCATVPVNIEQMQGEANGYFSRTENRIVIRQGMSQMQTIKTLVHETAHSILHCEGGEEKEADRLTKEVEAESVAFVVCNALGIDSSDYSFGYIAGWSSGKDTKELKHSMTIIQKTADSIIKKISSENR